MVFCLASRVGRAAATARRSLAPLVCNDGRGRSSHARGTCRQHDLATLPGQTTHDGDGLSAERRALGRGEDDTIGRVAVGGRDQFAWATHGERDCVVRSRHESVVCVEYPKGHERKIVAVSFVDTDILRSRFTIETDTWIPWETPALE